MKKDFRILVFEVVGNPLCVASDDGQKVFERITAAIQAEQNVKLSFTNVSTLTSAFLNTAIGQLYDKFPEEKIRSSLSLEDIEPDDLALLKRVVDTAKQYFKDTARFKAVVREEMED